MKRILAYLIVFWHLCSLSAQIQTSATCWGIDQSILPKKPTKVKYNWKRAIAPASLCFVSGATWGLHEATAHHWGSFHARFPNANPKFWNPAISWETKEYLGYKFDAKHLLTSTTQITGFGAGIFIGIGERRPFWHYALDVGISFGAYTLGNAITYDLLYR